MTPADWTGRVGESWAGEWRRTDRSFAGLDPALEPAVLAAASPSPIRAVDLGCGAGTTALAVARARPDAEVIGLDLSRDLLAVAGRRREDQGLANLSFAIGDSATTAAAVAPVDLFFSRHGVMFFDDPNSAFRRFAAAAAPGAALVFSCFAAIADNPWATEPVGVAPPSVAGTGAVPGPFAFADPARVAAILTAAGWAAYPPQRVAFRYVAGAGEDAVADAVDFFGRIGPAARALRDSPAAGRPALLDRVVAACRRRLDGGTVSFPAAAWLWTAHREAQA